MVAGTTIRDLGVIIGEWKTCKVNTRKDWPFKKLSSFFVFFHSESRNHFPLDRARWFNNFAGIWNLTQILLDWKYFWGSSCFLPLFLIFVVWWKSMKLEHLTHVCLYFFKHMKVALLFLFCWEKDFTMATPVYPINGRSCSSRCFSSCITKAWILERDDRGLISILSLMIGDGVTHKKLNNHILCLCIMDSSTQRVDHRKLVHPSMPSAWSNR